MRMNSRVPKCIWVSSTLYAILLLGCSNSSTKNEEVSSSIQVMSSSSLVGPESSTGGSSSGSDDPGKKALSDTIFNDDVVRTYEILIHPDSLAKIDNNPTAEEYVEATAFIIGTDTIGPVGVRYKGNEGAWWGCTTEHLSGAKTCAKLPMKIKINWNRDTTFFGLKKFQLHSMNLYQSQLRERVGYWFFRQMGVEAPRVVNARLKINGKEAGLFAHVEEIDGRFTKYHFENGSGNLYKEAWPLYGNEVTSESQILSRLETNEEVADISIFKSFGSDLAQADSSSIKSVIEKWMDVDKILRLAAVSYGLDDDDGPFHWYSQGGATLARPHNFYFYEDPLLRKVQMIPWDVDHMLDGVASPDVSNAVELIDGWGEISNNCEEFGQGWPQKSAACDKLVAGWASYKEEYKAIQQQLLSGPFQAIVPVLAKWESQLRPVTEQIYSADSRFQSVDSWEYGVTQLRQELNDAKARIEASLKN